MSKVLVFGGTTEGRAVAELLSENKVECDVCVATEYGEMVMDELPFVNVKQGRLDASEMKKLVESGEYCAVIDATHPFAVEVSQNIRNSVGEKLPLIRFERDTKLKDDESVVYFDDASACAEALEHTDGKVLLTTGSKELSVFCRSDTLRKRLVARVLPGLESVRLCYDAGLDGKQIIAMQGPFSERMNRAVIEEYGISVLVMKESGKTGGADEKISAAKNAGIPCYVIRRPVEIAQSVDSANTSPENVKTSADGVKSTSNVAESRGGNNAAALLVSDYVTVSSMDGLCRALEATLSLHLTAKHKLFVTLAGIGMGGAGTMTAAVKKRLSVADCVFGALRMLESAGLSIAGVASATNGTCATYPYYLASDIIPVLKEMLENPPHGKTGTIRAVVLFSGDPGFYSGAEKLKTALAALSDCSIEVLPGISSIQYLAAKLGLSWQNAAIMSLHGVPETEWLPVLKNHVKSARTVFFLTSGAADIRRIGSILASLRDEPEMFEMVEYVVFAGYHLSYPDEKIIRLTLEECADADEKGLCSGMIVPKDCAPLVNLGKPQTLKKANS